MLLKRLLSSALIFFTSMYYTQTIKILFDASKAETAGNADWIIDADNHNIGFPSSSGGAAVVGAGNESNPQQLPTPSQSLVTTSTAETFWEGSLSYMGIDCVNQGYHIETLPYNGQITYGNTSNPQDLSHYKVFVVCEPNIVFTTAEKVAMMHFIQNGGGLFMISDHTVSDRNNDGWDSPAIWNDFVSNNTINNTAFGLSYNLMNFSETSSNIPVLAGDSLLHGPFGNVTQVKWSNGTSVKINHTQNPSVKGVVYMTGSSFKNDSIMCAYGRYGNGKFATIGDSSPCDDGTGDPNDVLYNGYTADAAGNHRRVLMNIIIWLTEGNPSTTLIQTNTEQYKNISIYPNPNNGKFTITAPTNFSFIEVYNLIGEKIYTQEIINNNSNAIDVSEISLSKGIYFVNIKMPNNFSIVKKIIIE